MGTLIINFKEHSTGFSALALANKIEKYRKNAIVCPSFSDIGEIARKTDLKIYSQYIDDKILPGAVRVVGGKGTLINHSDHPISIEKIKELIKSSKSAGLKVVVCVKSLIEAKEVKKLKPDAIAFEDPKLIGTGKSITKNKTKDVENFSKIVGKSSISLCGAGISSLEDYNEAIKLGCDGVLISSAIAKNKDAEELLRSLGSVK